MWGISADKHMVLQAVKTGGRMRLSFGQVLRLAGVTVLTCVFWCCALLDEEGIAYPVLILGDLVLLVALIYDLLRTRGATSPDFDGLRLTGAARSAYGVLFVVWGVLTLAAIVTDARVGAYSLSGWMLTVEVFMPTDLIQPPRDAPSYDPPLPLQR